MNPNKKAHLICLIASAVITVISLIAVIFVRHDWLAALSLLISNTVIMGACAIPLLIPKLSFNYRPQRVDGHWKTVKKQIHPNLILGLICFICVFAVGLSALFL